MDFVACYSFNKIYFGRFTSYCIRKQYLDFTIVMNKQASICQNGWNFFMKIIIFILYILRNLFPQFFLFFFLFDQSKSFRQKVSAARANTPGLKKKKKNSEKIRVLVEIYYLCLKNYFLPLIL